MCGALVALCMRYGVWDTSLLKNFPIMRFDLYMYNVCKARVVLACSIIMIECDYSGKQYASLPLLQTLRMVDKGYLLPPPPGTSKEIYKIMIQCWYVTI